MIALTTVVAVVVVAGMQRYRSFATQSEAAKQLRSLESNNSSEFFIASDFGASITWADLLAGRDPTSMVVRASLDLPANDLDRALKLLSLSPELEELNMCGATLSRLRAQYIAQHFRNLRALEMFETTLTDDAAEELSRLSKLHSLCINNCDLSARALLLIGRGCTELEVLDLSGCQLHHDAMMNLQVFFNLKRLTLSHAVMEPDSLAYLRELGTLEFLDVRDIHVSSKMRQELRAANPKIKIYGSIN